MAYLILRKIIPPENCSFELMGNIEMDTPKWYIEVIIKDVTSDTSEY